MRIENPAAFRFIIDEDLYLLDKDKNSLTAAPVTSPEAISKPEAVAVPVIDFKYLGNNQKSFLIVVHYTNDEFINETHLAALTNILKRKELTTDDVAIFNLAKYNVVDFEELITYFNPQKILLMGKHTLLPGTDTLAHNQPKKLNNCLFLYSFSFDDMMDSNDNKKAFWEQMKTL